MTSRISDRQIESDLNSIRNWHFYQSHLCFVMIYLWQTTDEIVSIFSFLKIFWFLLLVSSWCISDRRQIRYFPIQPLQQTTSLSWKISGICCFCSKIQFQRSLYFGHLVWLIILSSILLFISPVLLHFWSYLIFAIFYTTAIWGQEEVGEVIWAKSKRTAVFLVSRPLHSV